MGDLSTGVLIAVGAALVGGILWLLRNGFKSAVVAETSEAVTAAVAAAVPVAVKAAVAGAIAPYAADVAAHMAGEEQRSHDDRVWKSATDQTLAALTDGQKAIHDQFQQNELDHLAFTERLHTLENPE